jgi:chromosome partitioning protein
MKVIAVSNPKGGSGKTTVTTNLACFFAKFGYSVLVLDCDSQSSAKDWASMRASDLPRVMVVATTAEQLLDRLQNARNTDAPKAVVLLDLPAAFPVELELALYPYIDAMLIPTNTSPIDIRAMVRHVFDLYKQFLDEQTTPAVGVIVNRAKPHTRLHQLVYSGFLQRIAFPLVGELRDTQNYPSASHEGKGVVELPLRQSIKDLLQWKPVLEWLSATIFQDDPFSWDFIDTAAK